MRCLAYSISGDVPSEHQAVGEVILCESQAQSGTYSMMVEVGCVVNASGGK